jgi:DNA-binding transcriptional MerR regulator
MTLRHLLYWQIERRNILKQPFYSTSHFAKLADVTVRTLRYYDRVGLLSPAMRTEAGHRLYTEADLVSLQQILALKFLGFPLNQIKHCLQGEPADLQAALSLQKTMLEESRARLDQIILALEQAKGALRENGEDWCVIVNLIRMYQMSQNFTQKYYTQEQKQKIAEWGKSWTAEDQQAITSRWDAVGAELRRLVDAKADPASPPAQALAREWSELVGGFTHGDGGIQQSLNKMYADLAQMPEQDRPFPIPYSPAGGEFIKQALKIYQQSKGTTAQEQS